MSGQTDQSWESVAAYLNISEMKGKICLFPDKSYRQTRLCILAIPHRPQALVQLRCTLVKGSIREPERLSHATLT